VLRHSAASATLQKRHIAAPLHSTGSRCYFSAGIPPTTAARGGCSSGHLQMPQESSSAFHVHVATACHSSIFTFMLEGARYVFPGAGVRTASATTARSALLPGFPRIRSTRRARLGRKPARNVCKGLSLVDTPQGEAPYLRRNR
jgi:hypothetical protein